jgi:hypothetical protein
MAGTNPASLQRDGRNYITPSQDQGVCQASTAFAITDAMNARLRIMFKIAVGDAKQILVPDLSAADLFYCGGGSCTAGQDVEPALGYATDKGIVPAYDIPYKRRARPAGEGPPTWSRASPRSRDSSPNARARRCRTPSRRAARSSPPCARIRI